MSKQEATRLADALRRCAPVDFDGDFAAAAALLERWPDGEPYCYIYEWDTAGGVHRDTTLTRWNGAGPVRSIPVYTAPPAERLAELERERDHFKALWRAREPSAERIAALEEEQVRLKDAVRSARVDEAHCWSRRNDALESENARLLATLNTPELHDFAKAVALEGAHQRLRWGAAHDEGKSPEDWFWTLGYLGGKALAAVKAGDIDKALHHTITAAALLANWHAAIDAARSKTT